MAIKVANNNSLSAITALPASVSGGAMTLISTQTASSSATIQFTSGIDSTYKEYIIKIYDMHPATDNHIFEFQGNASGGSGFNETITSTCFRSFHTESDSTTDLAYLVNDDLAQGTDHQHLANGVGNGNDESLAGELHLFDPSNTTFVKHFIAKFNFYEADSGSNTYYTAGYFNTTSAIDEIQFKMASGNIDAGTFKLYGVS